MVSLSAVEGYAADVWPGHMHAVVSIPDTRKGEQIVLITDKQQADRRELSDYAKGQGITELMVPRDIRSVDAVPLLGTGKIDYMGVKAMVEG